MVTNGTLQSGQSVVAGTCSGRIRLMTDYKGRTIKKAGPATAVEILGLTDVPQAGDEFNAVKEDKVAREIAEHRKEKLREEILARNASTTLGAAVQPDQRRRSEGTQPDYQGRRSGICRRHGILAGKVEQRKRQSKHHPYRCWYGNRIRRHAGRYFRFDHHRFQRKTEHCRAEYGRQENIQIRTYRVIYDVLDDVEKRHEGNAGSGVQEEILGKVEIRNTFKVPGVGIVGGAYVQEGKVVRNAEVRLVRDGIVVHEGKISSLKRFKDDAKEVAQGYECGIGIEDYNDIKEGDIIECFHMVEIERK